MQIKMKQSLEDYDKARYAQTLLYGTHEGPLRGQHTPEESEESDEEHRTKKKKRDWSEIPVECVDLDWLKMNMVTNGAPRNYGYYKDTKY